jgi:Rieske Fe-S protein
MPNGQVDIRRTKDGKRRLRFYAVADDQLETILSALRIARHESGTAYDCVALDAICTHFLATYAAENLHAKSESVQKSICHSLAE